MPIYLAFALATGSVVLAAVATFFGRFVIFQSILAMLAIVLASVLKFIYWRMLERAKRTHSMAAATGLGEGVRQWEVPHTSTNFIMKEMGYVVGRRHTQKLRLVTLFFLNISFLLMYLSTNWPWLTYFAVPSIAIAAWVERWLFFAQAEHVVGLFYGKQSA